MTQKPGRHGSSVLVSPAPSTGTAKTARDVRALEGRLGVRVDRAGLLANRIRDSPEQAGISGCSRELASLPGRMVDRFQALTLRKTRIPSGGPTGSASVDHGVQKALIRARNVQGGGTTHPFLRPRPCGRDRASSVRGITQMTQKDADDAETRLTGVQRLRVPGAPSGPCCGTDSRLTRAGRRFC